MFRQNIFSLIKRSFQGAFWREAYVRIFGAIFLRMISSGLAPMSVLTCVAAIVVGLMFFAKIQSDRKIKRTVVSLHPSV